MRLRNPSPYILSILILLLAPSCARQIKRAKGANNEQVNQLEARLVDIPLVLDAHLDSPDYLESLEESDNVVFSYKTSMPIDSVEVFYKQSMELFGWREIAHITQRKESSNMLAFQKPHRICVVTANTDPHGAAVMIFTGPGKFDDVYSS